MLPTTFRPSGRVWNSCKASARPDRPNTTTQAGGCNAPLPQLAKGEELNRSYFSRVLRLAYLAPDITLAILEGRQPPGLTIARLTTDADLPLAWPAQRKALGFD